MKNSIFLLVFLFLSYSININTQVSQEWVSRYNGPGNSDDNAYAICVDESGNVYVTGASKSSISDFDYATVKYNSIGVQQWVARFNLNSSDGANSIAVDVSGNVYVTGSSGTIKYNSIGVQQWVSTTGRMNAIALDANNNVYVTGTNGSDFLTIKYNSSGVQQWAQLYFGPGVYQDVASAIALDKSGNVYVTGYSSLNVHHCDFATVKYNSSGVQQWVQMYGPGDYTDFANAIVVDLAGNVYVTGRSYLSGTSYDFATVKYNSSGFQQWVQRYNGPGNYIDGAYSIALDSSGNIYVTGSSYGNGTSEDYATIKYNSTGIQQWVQRYNGLGNGQDRAYSMVLDGLDNVYVTGASLISGTNRDYTTIKYNSLGAQQWIQSYDGPVSSTDDAYSIAVDVLGNVYVTGTSTGSGTFNDYATVKYSQMVGIKTITTEIPNKFSLSQNYPNPFNPFTRIGFNVADFVLVKISVFDILGREATVLVNEALKPGVYEVNFDGSGFSSGVYFFNLKAGSFTDTKKMMLVK